MSAGCAAVASVHARKVPAMDCRSVMSTRACVSRVAVPGTSIASGVASVNWDSVRSPVRAMMV